jgi:hypothetical protein
MLVTAAETLVWLGRFDEAHPLFDRILGLDPPFFQAANVRVARAFLRLWQGEFQAARADLSTVVETATSPWEHLHAAWAQAALADLAVGEEKPTEARAAVARGLAAEHYPDNWRHHPRRLVTARPRASRCLEPGSSAHFAGPANLRGVWMRSGMMIFDIRVDLG